MGVYRKSVWMTTLSVCRNLGFLRVSGFGIWGLVFVYRRCGVCLRELVAWKVQGHFVSTLSFERLGFLLLHLHFSEADPQHQNPEPCTLTSVALYTGPSSQVLRSSLPPGGYAINAMRPRCHVGRRS